MPTLKGTFGFAQPQIDQSAKPKEPFSSTLQKIITIMQIHCTGNIFLCSIILKT